MGPCSHSVSTYSTVKPAAVRNPTAQSILHYCKGRRRTLQQNFNVLLDLDQDPPTPVHSL